MRRTCRTVIPDTLTAWRALGCQSRFSAGLLGRMVSRMRREGPVPFGEDWWRCEESRFQHGAYESDHLPDLTGLDRVVLMGARQLVGCSKSRGSESWPWRVAVRAGPEHVESLPPRCLAGARDARRKDGLDASCCWATPDFWLDSSTRPRYRVGHYRHKTHETIHPDCRDRAVVDRVGAVATVHPPLGGYSQWCPRPTVAERACSRPRGRPRGHGLARTTVGTETTACTARHRPESLGGTRGQRLGHGRSEEHTSE